MADEKELFGSPEQIALMQRGRDLWALVSDSRQFSYYGRMVSLCDPGADALEKLTGLAGLQGAASCQYYPAADADAFCEAIRAKGFNPARYE